MKKFFILIIALLSCAAIRAEPNTAVLEQGYRAEAGKLKECLIARFAEKEASDQILGSLRRAEANHSDESGLRFETISLSPPMLRQDQNDLYNRFISVVIFRFTRVDAGGKDILSKPYEVILPARANPEMKWTFPSCEDAIAAVAAKCNESAMAILNVQLEIARLKAETAKRKRGD